MTSRDTTFPPSPREPLADYLLYRQLDPLFAITIGASAVVLRVRREEVDKGQSVRQTVDTLRRRVGIATAALMRTQ